MANLCQYLLLGLPLAFSYRAFCYKRNTDFQVISKFVINLVLVVYSCFNPCQTQCVCFLFYLLIFFFIIRHLFHCSIYLLPSVAFGRLSFVSVSYIERIFFFLKNRKKVCTLLNARDVRDGTC